MPQTGFTPIQLYSSSTPTNAPAAGDLVNDTKGSELAVNIADGKLFYKDSTNNVQTLADKNWIGTVTNVSALTIGTTGTDLSSTVANPTSTPVITLNVPTASAANRGALSSTDWSTFNNKQAALVSGTNIKTVSGTSLLGSGDLGTIGVGYGGTGTSTAFTTGSVVFAGASGVYTQDNANLFWDDTNDCLGVGTAPTLGTAKIQAAAVAADPFEGYRFGANANGPTVSLYKNRGASVGTNTVVASGDELGTLAFRGYDGAAYRAGAFITGAVDGTPGSSDMPGRLVFSTTADGAATPTERMRLNNAGNLLIGATADSGAGVLQVTGKVSITDSTNYATQVIPQVITQTRSRTKFTTGNVFIVNAATVSDAKGVRLVCLGTNDGSGATADYYGEFLLFTGFGSSWVVHEISNNGATHWTVTLSDLTTTGFTVTIADNHAGSDNRDTFTFIESYGMTNITVTT
jgi:hypothetical protein